MKDLKEIKKKIHPSPMNVAVIGGGAAGFFAAIKCAEENPQARVTIFEKGAHVLTKVRISGGGRCNVTHACFQPKVLVTNYPRGGAALLGPFTKFQPTDTIKWFEDRGIPLKTEEDGRVFPTTDTSVTIINALKDAAAAAQVHVRTFAGPVSIVNEGPYKFKLELSSGETLFYQRVLLACGSDQAGHEWARSMGHSIEPPVPSLFTFTVPDTRFHDLSGISLENVDLQIVGTKLRQKGPLLITHWGLSGPAVLKLSAWGARVLFDRQYNAQLQINWVGGIKQEVAQVRFREFRKTNARKHVSVHSPYVIPHRLWERLVFSTGLNATQCWADLSNVQLDRLVEALTAGIFVIRGKSTFKEEFVTCGGVRLDEVDFRTMESRRCPGLYFAGEVLDIDGVTGGFNFQSAWTTGWLAGRAMAAPTPPPTHS